MTAGDPSACPPAPEPEPTSEPANEDLLRLLVRAAFALVAVEVACTVVLLLSFKATWWKPPPEVLRPLLAHAMGFGLGAALAYAWADALAARGRWALGLGMGVLLAPLAPLAGTFELHLLVGGEDVASATRAVTEMVERLDGRFVAILGAGAVFVHAPALVCWRRGVGLAGALAASAWGGAALSLALAPFAAHFDDVRLSTWWTLLGARCLLFPPALVAGDLLGGLVSRLVRRAPRAPWRPHLPRPRAAAPLLLLVPLLLLARAALAPAPTTSGERLRLHWTGKLATCHEVGVELAFSRSGSPPSGSTQSSGMNAFTTPWLHQPGILATVLGWEPLVPDRLWADRRRTGLALLRRAAARGHVDAMRALSRALAPDEHRRAEAEQWLRRAAEAGDGRSTIALQALDDRRAGGQEASFWWAETQFELASDEVTRLGATRADLFVLLSFTERGGTLRLRPRWPAPDTRRVAGLLPVWPGPQPRWDLAYTTSQLTSGQVEDALFSADYGLESSGFAPEWLTILGMSFLGRACKRGWIDLRDIALAIAALTCAEASAPRDPATLVGLGVALAIHAVRHEDQVDAAALRAGLERLVLAEALGQPEAAPRRRAAEALADGEVVVGVDEAWAALARRHAAWAAEGGPAAAGHREQAERLARGERD
ncbi:MAG: hypothetical protein M9894_30555 [Planctomycetes bacterium]|nr:hypothetical protein [Planctomycetota bacterium]